MNASLRHLALFLALASSVPAAAPAPVSLEHQIDVLLKRRLKPEPLPLDLPNPFVLKSRRDASPARMAEVAPPVPEARPISTAEVLADCVSHLRIGGIIRMKDQMQIVINDIPRKEGDPINVLWNNTQIQIRLLRLAPDQVVLRYLGSEQVVKL